MCSGPGAHPQVADLRRMRDALGTLDLVDIFGRLLEFDQASGVEAPEPEVAAFLRERFVQSNPASLMAMTQALLDTPDQVADLRATGLATQVIYGERDNAWGLDVQDAMAQRLGITPIVIADADHSPAIEQPDTTARVLGDLFSADPARTRI